MIILRSEAFPGFISTDLLHCLVPGLTHSVPPKEPSLTLRVSTETPQADAGSGGAGHAWPGGDAGEPRQPEPPPPSPTGARPLGSRLPHESSPTEAWSPTQAPFPSPRGRSGFNPPWPAAAALKGLASLFVPSSALGSQVVLQPCTAQHSCISASQPSPGPGLQVLLLGGTVPQLPS